MNFWELWGSEQAVAETQNSFVEDSDSPEMSIRDFATQSFNSLSANLLKSALRGKIKSESQNNESMITKWLKETMTYKSKVLLICAVSPISEYFDHSLPALKFWFKIRKWIHKNLLKLRDKRNKKIKDKENGMPKSSRVNQSSTSLDSIWEEFMGKVSTRLNSLKNDIVNSHFQDFNTTNNVTEDNDEFISWYKVKIRDINQLIEELIKESKNKNISKYFEDFINSKSDEWINLK